jgi:hypothetical protein
VPSFRWKDNVIQAAAVGAGLLLGALVGPVVAWFMGGHPAAGALAGGFIGVIAGLLLSGTVLMVVGWVRAARTLRRMHGPDAEDADGPRRPEGGA